MTTPTKESLDSQGNAAKLDRGELFSMLLRLHPTEPGMVSPSAGNQVQAAFLDMVRQGDPALADWLHAPNQRRPYTLGLLQGFNHLTTQKLTEAITKNQMVQVTPGQVYWLCITMLDVTVFGAAFYFIANLRTLTLRIGDARFEISRLLSTPDPDYAAQSWVAYSSFSGLYRSQVAQKHCHFEFAQSPQICNIVAMAPASLITHAHCSGDYYELDQEGKKSGAIGLPARMSYQLERYRRLLA